MHFFFFSVILRLTLSMSLEFSPSNAVISGILSFHTHHERACLMNTSNPSSRLARKLWDGILKSILHHMPDQFFPLLKHVFGRDYPKGTSIELLSAEYSTPGKSNPQNLSSIFADIVMRVAGTDLYHLEGQMEKETHLTFRMFEYDTHIALLYGVSEDYKNDSLPGADTENPKQMLHFPASIVLYLDHNRTVSGQNTCQVILSESAKAVYSVSVIKIQDYSLRQIRENHLTLFLPFTLLRFRPRLNAVKNPVTKKELTMFVNKIIIILKDELSDNHITQRQYKDYINYLRDAANQILIHHTELQKEVMNMLTELVPSYSELEDQLTEQITAKVTREITDEVTARVTDEVTAKVTGEVTARVTGEVTARVTGEVTARVTDEMTMEFQKKLQEETALFILNMQKKESQLSAANSENARLRALLETHGIDITEQLP